MNKEIDWHGQPAHSLVFKDWDRPVRVRDIWNRPLIQGGAWPKDAECPAGWDERDSLV